MHPPAQPNDADWKLFELRHRNLLAISKAQKVHLTTLLLEIALFWVWYVSGSKDVTVQGVALSSRGVWAAIPALLTFFCLAFMGSVNAALPARKKLEDVSERLGLRSEAKCGFAFYDLDTDKNVLDYLTFLKFSPKNNEFDQTNRFNPRHFLYPIVMVASAVTTAFAWKGFASCGGHIYVVVCVAVQTRFLIRPLWRSWGRFLGRAVDN